MTELTTGFPWAPSKISPKALVQRSTDSQFVWWTIVISEAVVILILVAVIFYLYYKQKIIVITHKKTNTLTLSERYI